MRLLALGLCLLAALALSASPAPAQDRSPKPSPQELWRDYPLDEGGQQRAAPPSPTQSAASRADPASAARPSDDAGAEGTIAAVLLVAAVAVATAGVVLLLRRRRGPAKATGIPLAPAAAAPGLGLAGPQLTGNHVMFTPASLGPRPPRAVRSQGPRGGERQADSVPPPDTGRAWTAEIQWRHSDEESRFCVVAHDRDTGEETVIARSEPLEWPPTDSDAVHALVDAADALTEALESAGWTQLEPGTTWYERRFQWEAVAPPENWAPPVPPPAPRSAAPPPRTAAPTRRFGKKPWPEGTEALWRCEIRWSPGYTRSRFEAVAHDPERRSDRVVGTSTSFKWMLMADPDPTSAAFRDQVRSLAAALEAAGWEPLGTGAQWYSERFVWRGADQPPDRVEPAPVKADRAS